MADEMYNFIVNECKCSETGENHRPQLYIDGFDGNKSVQLWFAAFPQISHAEVDRVIAEVRRTFKSCHVQVSNNLYAHARLS